jgi:hypothetical protein
MTRLDVRFICGLGFVALAPVVVAIVGPALADELFAPAPAVDVSKLVRIEDRNFQVDYADWVSTRPIATSRVRKVEAGRVTEVIITSTDTGTYSSDAMFSRHVRYPGISVEEVAFVPNPELSSWANGTWEPLATRNARSIQSLY